MAAVEEADALIAQGDKADPAAVKTATDNVKAAKNALVPTGGVDPQTDSEVKPVDTDSETKPVETDSETKPVDTDSETKPVDTDSETKPVDTDTTPVAPGKGDLNGDGKVSLKDASLAQKIALDLIAMNDGDIDKADMNGDGKISLIDAYAIQILVNQKYSK